MAESTTTVLHKHYADVKGNGKTMHSFAAEDGRKYVTFKADLGAAAAALLNQPVKLGYTFQQKGQYENYYLEGVEAVNGSAPVAAASTPAQAGSVASDPRQASIQRQVALKGAIELAAVNVIDLADIETTADRLLGWIEGNA